MNSIWIFIKNKLQFFTLFVICKGLVFLTPLLLADVLNVKDFGILEYALAGLGFVLNALFNLGVPGSYPYFILKKKEFGIKNGFSIHPLWLSIVFTIQTFLYLTQWIDEKIYLAMNIAFVISNQIFYSVKLKSHEKIVLAIIVDSGIYLVLFGGYVISKLDLMTISISSINIIVILYCLYYCFIGVKGFINAGKTNILINYKHILKYSGNLLVASFLIFIITSSGRILVEWFFGLKEVGIYGYYFRLAAIVVMIYQVINITMFKKMYTLKPEILDKYFAMFFTCIYGLSILFYLVLPLAMKTVSTFFNETYSHNKMVYFILSSQMIVWIASALNSNIIDRENLIKPNNIRFLILVVLFLLGLIVFRDFIGFTLLTYLIYIVIFTSCFIQYYSLRGKGIFFNKSSVVLFVSFVLTSLVFYLG